MHPSRGMNQLSDVPGRSLAHSLGQTPHVSINNQLKIWYQFTTAYYRSYYTYFGIKTTWFQNMDLKKIVAKSVFKISF